LKFSEEIAQISPANLNDMADKGQPAVFVPNNQNGIRCGIRKNEGNSEEKTENDDPDFHQLEPDGAG
jgi:hypothetical protein